MMRIGIDINEVLRARFIQFERYYYEENKETIDPDAEVKYIYDIFKEYDWQDGVQKIKFLKDDAPESISPIDYQVNDKGESNADCFLFTEEEESFTAREKYNKFMYEDYNFEIHGSAPVIYKNIDVDLSKLIKENKDIEFIAFSKENYLSIPPTLYFLGKNQCRFKKVIFVDNVQEMWNDCDVLITTDPELIQNKPEDKKLIKVTRPYNEHLPLNVDLEILQIKELIGTELLNKIKE